VTLKKFAFVTLISLSLGLGLLWMTGNREVETEGRPSEDDSASFADKGKAAFFGAGFGGISLDSLSSNGVPWRLAATALVMEERRTDPSAPLNAMTLNRVLARFGFLTPTQVVNGPMLRQYDDLSLPLGMTRGTISPVGGTSIYVANLGCASCHAGVTYAPDGGPLPKRVMLGMPNTSLDLEAYTQAVFVALRRHIDAPDLLETAERLFPNMSLSERLSLRWIVMPLAKKRLKDLQGVDRPLPFPNGSPGNTNGVAALKFALGTPLLGGGKADAGFVSIPDLGDRVWKTSLLADGAYAIPERPAPSAITRADLSDAHLKSLGAIATFFSVPSMGVHPDQAHKGLNDATSIMHFLKDYRAQPFPGVIDANKATRGASVYEATCASCHGTYDKTALAPRLISYPNWIGEVGTDRLRSTSFDRALQNGIEQTSYKQTFSVKIGQGYVAPPLSGIWASAPYLHNGSVPSLRALFDPSQRHARFKVGGHGLDLTTVGIRLDANGDYPAGYRPFSTPAWVDTKQPGLGNGGHIYGNDLAPSDKDALIEYLKSL
jgi:cytochrome c5